MNITTMNILYMPTFVHRSFSCGIPGLEGIRMVSLGWDAKLFSEMVVLIYISMSNV